MSAPLNLTFESASFVFHPIIPRELIKAIDAKVSEDGGDLYRQHLKEITKAMIASNSDAYRKGSSQDFRSHIGASVLGNDCLRAIWYEFRWADAPSFEGRILRLFHRGTLEEARFLAYFKMLGADLYYAVGGKQYSIRFADGHAGGSIDAVGSEVPYVQLDTPYLLEFKTHSESSFTQLAGSPKDWRDYLAGRQTFQGDGVKRAQPTHYVQMQLYMHGFELPAALYCAVDKNTDDLYIEEVPYNRELALQYIARTERVIQADIPPPKISDSRGYYKCRLCNFQAICHEDKLPARNCRTCLLSVVGPEGQWGCSFHNVVLNKQDQLVGCDHYAKPNFYGDVPF